MISLLTILDTVILEIISQEETIEYADTVYPVKLHYPSDWYVDELHTPLGETDRVIQIANFYPSNNDPVIIRLLIDNIPGTNDIDSYVQHTISSYTNNHYDFKLIDSDIVDQTYQMTYTFLDEHQNQIKNTEYAFYNNNFVYYVEFSSPIDQYNHYYDYFQNLLFSISFENNQTSNISTDSISIQQKPEQQKDIETSNLAYQGKTTKLGINLKAYENPYFGIMSLKLPSNWVTSENQTTLKISPSDDRIEERVEILLNSYYFDGRSMSDILTDFYNANLGYITESRPVTVNSKYDGHLFTLTSYYQGTNIPFDKRLVIFISPPNSSDNSYYYLIEYFSNAKTFEKYLSSAISIIKSVTFGSPVENEHIKRFIKSSPL